MTEPSRSGPALAAGSDLHLGFPDYCYADLYDSGRLRDLTDLFFSDVKTSDPGLMSAWNQYRSAPASLDAKGISELLVRMAPHLGRFLARLFKIEKEAAKIL